MIINPFTWTSQNLPAQPFDFCHGNSKVLVILYILPINVSLLICPLRHLKVDWILNEKTTIRLVCYLQFYNVMQISIRIMNLKKFERSHLHIQIHSILGYRKQSKQSHEEKSISIKRMLFFIGWQLKVSEARSIHPVSLF